jgi:hypothetical protein
LHSEDDTAGSGGDQHGMADREQQPKMWDSHLRAFVT